MFSTMRINMVGHLLMGHVKAMDMNAICKPLSTLFKYNVIEELMPEPLYAGKLCCMQVSYAVIYR